MPSSARTPRLNDGDPEFLLRLRRARPRARLPGRQLVAAMFRPVEKGRDCHVTHWGVDASRPFADRFVATRIQFAIEDILVNGPPWHLRIALRVDDFIAGPNRRARCYNNRVVAFIRLRWLKLVRWEDYEDCEHVAASGHRGWRSARNSSRTTMADEGTLARVYHMMKLSFCLPCLFEGSVSHPICIVEA